MTFTHNELSGKVYLSDWYKCYNPDYESLLKLYRLMFACQSNQSIQEMYYDMIFAISREYQIHLESYEYLAYGFFSSKTWHTSSYGNKYSPTIPEMQWDQEDFNYLQWIMDQYGDDYIRGEEALELLLPEDDEWILNELEDFVPDDSDMEYDNIDNEDYEEAEPSEDTEVMPEDVDDQIYDDPIKLLKWLEEKSSK